MLIQEHLSSLFRRKLFKLTIVPKTEIPEHRFHFSKKS